MNKRFEYDIFLSFSSADEAEAKPIWQELSANGLRIFWSDETLKNNVGESFFQVIQYALENSKHFVLLCTPKAMQSKWVKLEYEAFFTHCHLPEKRIRRFVIYRGKGFYQASLPIFLKNIQTTQSLKQIIHITGGVDIQVLQQENRDLKDQLNQSEIKINKVLNENKNLNSQNTSLQASIEKSQNQLSDMENERNGLLTEIDGLKKQNQSQQEAIKQSNNKFSEMKRRLLKKIKQLQSNQKSSHEVQILEKEKSPPEPETQTTKKEDEIFTNKFGITFKRIQSGTFMMGEEKDQRKVTISQSFYMGITQVTQEQWEAVMGNNPSSFKGKDLPVESVSWNDAQSFVQKLNQMDKTDAYRLPTEAEWEYSCRAGSTTEYCFGDDSAQLAEYAWYDKNKTHPVAQLNPNAWGLYDMHGNVWEWCEDTYSSLSTQDAVDPLIVNDTGSRVVRGGSWINNAGYCRSADRDWIEPGFRHYYLGFRLVFSRGQ
ncbi:MAG: SUMF1/EgtB/PvdO family nonheme iron enzyme [Candidatus Magnetomorum sp.]|nr:SUMF1/EgtB/PvdO family nonheme iron enzyme [Candidatus Magnetomorum sp.]